MVKLHDPISETFDRAENEAGRKEADVAKLLREFGIEDRVKLKRMKRLPPQRVGR